MEGPGFSFRGREASLPSALCFCCYVANKRGGLARGHLYHQFFSLARPTRRGGEHVFLAAVAGLMGISEGNDGGDFSKGVIARGFWPGVCGAHIGRAPL